MTSKIHGNMYFVTVVASLLPSIFVQQASALVVPDGECTCSVNPIMHDPQCHYSFVCNRTDSAPYTLTPGALSQPTGQELVCNTCCPDCDCANPPTLTHNCIGSVAISLSRSFSYSIASGVEAGIPGFKASLQQSFGFGGSATQTWSVSTGSGSFPSCQIGRYTVSVARSVGEVHAITHNYHWTTVLTSGPNPPCIPGPPIHNATCFTTRVSTAASDSWGAASAMWLGNTGCP